MPEQQLAQPQPIPQPLAHLIQLNVEYGVLICIGNGCRCAVSPASTSEHLRRKHHTARELRQQVDRYIQEFLFEYNYSSVRIPLDGLAPQPVIPVVDGLQCKHCPAKPFKTQSRKAIKVHRNKEHGKKRIADEDLFDPVKLQSWFREGKERYWVVDESKEPAQSGHPGQSASIGGVDELDDGDDDGEDGSNDDSNGQEEVEDQIAQEMQNWCEEVKERRLKLLAKVPVAELDSWLRFTGWNAVLAKSKHDIVQTYRFLRKPDADEPQLERLLVCWTRIFNRCLDTLAATDNPDVLKWIASPKNESMSKRLFQLLQNAQTISKYSGLSEHFLCYVLRTAPVDVDKEETETGVYFTLRQRVAIDKIRQLLKTNCLNDEYTDESEKDQDLCEALMNFYWLVLNQNMERETVYRSPLMYFLAVMGVDSAAECLRHSFVYTPYLAGVLWVNRLLMLEYALPLRAWLLSRVVVCDDVASVRARLEAVRAKRLCEGSFSPTSFILGQLAYGKMLNRTYTAQSNIHWSEDFQTLFFKGRPIKIRKLQEFGSAVITEARAALQ